MLNTNKDLTINFKDALLLFNVQIPWVQSLIYDVSSHLAEPLAGHES